MENALPSSKSISEAYKFIPKNHSVPSREMPGYTSRSQRHGRGHLQPLVLRSFSLKVPAARCRQRPRRLAGARADGWHQPPLQEHDRVTCSLGEAAVLLLSCMNRCDVLKPRTLPLATRLTPGGDHLAHHSGAAHSGAAQSRCQSRAASQVCRVGA